MSDYNALNQWLVEVEQGHNRSIVYKKDSNGITYANLVEDDCVKATIYTPKYPETSSINLRALNIIHMAAGILYTSVRPPTEEERLYYSRSRRAARPMDEPFYDSGGYTECPLCAAYYLEEKHPANNCSWDVDGPKVSKRTLQDRMSIQREEGKI